MDGVILYYLATIIYMLFLYFPLIIEDDTAQRYVKCYIVRIQYCNICGKKIIIIFFVNEMLQKETLITYLLKECI